MNFHAKAHLAQVLKRANALRAELESLAQDVRHTPKFLTFEDTPAHLAKEAEALESLAKEQQEVITGIEVILHS